MPHLFIKKPKELLYPFKKDKVEFLFKVGDLIACKVEDRKFFISLHESGYPSFSKLGSESDTEYMLFNSTE